MGEGLMSAGLEVATSVVAVKNVIGVDSCLEDVACFPCDYPMVRLLRVQSQRSAVVALKVTLVALEGLK